jgi:hypothetical protein
VYLLHDSGMLAKSLEDERLDRKAEIDPFGKPFALEGNRLLKDNTRSDEFNGACGSDIFHIALASKW